MGSHVSVGSQIVAISFIRLPTLIIPYTLFDLIMMQMCSRENLSLLLNHISKNSLPKNSLWTFMKALCELCGQIFVLMEFGQSLPFLLRDGERDEKIPFPNNSMGRIAKKLCFLVCLFLLFFSCPEQLNLKRQRTTYYWHYKLLIC